MPIAGKQLKVRNSLLSLISSLSGHSRLLQIGGWLLAGAATIGAGYHAWDNKDRELKRKWVYYRILILTFPCLTSLQKTSFHVGLQRWQRDAYVRTEEFRNQRTSCSTIWVLVDGREQDSQSQP